MALIVKADERTPLLTTVIFQRQGLPAGHIGLEPGQENNPGPFTWCMMIGYLNVVFATQELRLRVFWGHIAAITPKM